MVVHSWVENPHRPYFCGEEYFHHQSPIDPLQMTGFRTRLKPSGCEKLLKLTLATGVQTQAVALTGFKQATVDTTVQGKAITFPTDGRLYHREGSG